MLLFLLLPKAWQNCVISPSLYLVKLLDYLTKAHSNNSLHNELQIRLHFRADGSVSLTNQRSPTPQVCPLMRL